MGWSGFFEVVVVRGWEFVFLLLVFLLVLLFFVIKDLMVKLCLVVGWNMVEVVRVE